MVGAAALSACGYQPAYGPGGAMKAMTGRVAIMDPSDDNAFDLVVRLEERLGRATDPAFDLTYAVTTRQINLAITQVNAITRYNVEGEVRFTLKDRATGQVASSGALDAFTSYAASGTTVATDAARVDAYRRLMRLLADQIVTRMIADTAAR